MIRQQFTSEFESARRIISLILEQDDIGSEYSGEVAYFALQIHGWNQELKINTTKKGDLQ